MSSAAFWNKIAEKYAATPVSDMAAYEQKLEETAKYLTPESTVLELACGTGTTALHHAKNVRHIRAVDISENMIRIARRKAQGLAIENVDFEVASIDDLPDTDGPYDMVMAHSILHLVPDLEGTINKVSAMLKPGGVFVSSTVCLSEGFWFLRPVLPLMRAIGKAPPVWFLASETVRAHVKQSGLTIVHDWKPSSRSALFLIAQKAS